MQGRIGAPSKRRTGGPGSERARGSVASRQPVVAAPRFAPPPRHSVAAHYAAVPVAVPAAVILKEQSVALPLPRAVESAVDDPLLHNPLQRLERCSTGWFGVIADYEGVVVDSTLAVHKEAWRRVAGEMGLRMPLGSVMDRIQGVRDEVVIQQLFTWTRNPAAVAQIAARKDALYDELMSGNWPAEVPGVRQFLETVHKNKIPIAIASPLPDRRVRPALERLNLTRAFDAIVTAEDNPTAELENTYLAAAHQLGRPPLRCVVVGDCNRSVEAAKELGMRSVVVTGGQAAWSFSSSDLVVQRLDQLSFVNLKNLFGQEDLVEPSVPWEEVRASRAAADGEEYGSSLAAKGSGGSWQSGSGGGGFGGLSGFGSGSMSSSGTAWNDEDDEEQR